MTQLLTHAMNEQVEQLYKEYTKVRGVRLSEDQFVYLTKIYPALLVCMSDGVLDKEEWEGIVHITKGLAEEFVTPEQSREAIAMTFRTEFRYLLDHIDKWSKKFLNALRDSIKDDESDKEFVSETMYLFANAANGISQEEQDEIDALSKRLGLEH